MFERLVPVLTYVVGQEQNGHARNLYERKGIIHENGKDFAPTT